MEQRMNDINAPFAKVGTALGAGGGASIVNVVAERTSFLPQTLGEYLACASAAIAIIYTGALFLEWVVKKIIRGGFAK